MAPKSRATNREVTLRNGPRHAVACLLPMRRCRNDKRRTMGAGRKSSIWSVPFIALMAASFFQSTFAFAAHATLPVYASALGASTAMVGFVSGGFAVTALLVRPFAGPAFDSFSRKWLLVLALGIIGVSFLVLGIVDSLALLIVARMIQGVGIGCAGPLAMSLVSEYLPAEKFSSGISIFTLSQSFAQVIGPALGLFLVDGVGFPGMCTVAIISILVAIISLAFVKEPFREALPYELRLDRMFAKESITAAIAIMLLATAFSCTSAYVVLCGYSLGVGNLGAYFTVYAGCLLLTRPIFGRLSDVCGAPRVLLAGTMFFAMSYAALHFAHDFGGFMVAAVLGSAGYGVCMPLLQSLALIVAPMERRGAASNTAYTGLDLGMLLGPIIGGLVIEAFAGMMGNQAAAYSDMWLAMIIPIAAAFAIILYWNLKPARKGA